MHRLSVFFKSIGLLCFAAALLLTLHNFKDNHNAEAASVAAVDQLLSDIPAAECEYTTANTVVSENQPEVTEATEPFIPDYLLNPNMSMPEQTLDGYDYIGVLEIKELSLVLPVMSDWDYPRLKLSPCRYTGSAYQDNFVIMAHNFPSHFGRLSSLSLNSIVSFTDLDGNIFNYQVSEIEILDPTEISAVTSGSWDLTLFTCTIGGESRVTVRCEKTE